MDNESDEPQESKWILPARATRHDGWTGERMAIFCETLANNGIVSDACRAAGMSRESAYNARDREPVFAAAWQAAEYKARSPLGDGLLTRSIEGSVERYYHNGELVGERRYYENWLALRVLNRLDKLAESDTARGALSARMAADWSKTLDALRAAGPCSVKALIAPEVDKVDTPTPSAADERFMDGLWEYCWRKDDGTWMTAFPPPPGFDGYEKGAWDDPKYERQCTPDETEILEATEAGGAAEDRADADNLRDQFFTWLKSSWPQEDSKPG